MSTYAQNTHTHLFCFRRAYEVFKKTNSQITKLC